MRDESSSLLGDLQNGCDQVSEFIEGVSEAQYRSDELVRSAVERQLEIIGEALNALRKSDPELAEQIPDLRRIIELKNVLIHGYAVVDDSVVYVAATERVPEPRSAFEELSRNYRGYL